jgi:non-heme chloroperoxidase
MKSLTLAVVVSLVILAVIVGGAIAFGGPGNPPPMSSINNPFKNLDYSDLPAPSYFVARDGAKLTFRMYPSAGGDARGSVVLVHGSSARGSSMHVMAKAFAAAGYAAYALDIRGHGESGIKGHIAYVGQLEDDLEDFVRSVKTAQPTTLAGFSSGGGFVLRVAGSARQKLFSSYLLLSPFISQDAPTYRPDGGGWVRVGLPRLVAVALLNVVGVRVFNDLPVTKFALNEESKAILTSQYSFALAQNFRPERDYRANIRAAGQPLRVVAGQDDEVFYADQFAGVFRAEGKDVPVTLVPGIGHIPLTLEQAAVQAAVAAVRSMNEPRA